MIGKSPNQNQTNIFGFLLKEIINPAHELVILSNLIDWNDLEKKLANNYSHTGQPSKPIRLMAGVLILKQLYNYGDETIVEAWVQNPYYQYFCGEDIFKWKFPFDPSDLVHFRKRIGEQGMQFIFETSVKLHEDKIKKARGINVDTTVQEKNITYPTDTKLYKKILEHCRKIALHEDIKVRQSYREIQKDLLNIIRFSRSKKQQELKRKAQKKLHTITGCLVRDVCRKLHHNNQFETYSQLFTIFNKILAQKRSDKNKIYSIHEPHVACIAKGKQHTPYEFGNKVAIATTAYTNIIVGVASFTGNPHDSKTLPPVLDNVKQSTDKEFTYATVDRGFRGKTKIGNTEIIIPNNKKATRSKKKKLRNRSAIEPIISHVKHDYRMLRNYLKGIQGDTINALLACASFNFKATLREIKDAFLFFFCIVLSITNFKVLTVKK